MPACLGEALGSVLQSRAMSPDRRALEIHVFEPLITSYDTSSAAGGRAGLPGGFSLHPAGGPPPGESVRRPSWRTAGPRRDHGAAAHAHAVGDNGASTDPDIVFNHDALRRDALFHHRPAGVVENVVDGQDLHQRRGIHAVANRDAALAAQHVQLANQAVLADADEGMR